MSDVLTLEMMNVSTIYRVFEDAFTDYYVEFEKNQARHVSRWLSEGVDFAQSYGVKDQGELVGFILHSPRGETVKNLATGIRRTHQGMGLVDLMLKQSALDLKSRGYKKVFLEVITENHRAIAAYKKAGFVPTRRLLCWKGELNVTPVQLQGISATADFDPIEMSFKKLSGVDEASLRALITSMNLNGSHVGMINVPEDDVVVNNFFRRAGLENYVTQYEMVLKL